MKEIKHLKVLFALVAIFGILAISGCKRSSTTTSQEGTGELLNKEEIKSDVEEIIYPLPSPFELNNKLDDIGAIYVGKVLNPAENVSRYFTEKSKALAMGVYTADLSYAATYNKSQEVKMYSGALKSIIDDLGIDVDFVEYLNSESKETFENKDSLVSMVTNIVYDTYSFFNKKSDPALSALMISGVWIEGLFIATHISEDTFNNYEMVKLIYDQKSSLEKVIEVLDRFGDTEVVIDIAEALKKLKVLYDEAGSSLTNDQLYKITSTIETIRSSIIS
ncbi:MAG: hypothetical protein JXJ22_07785 [Bacteroidales bacterium]|nr:hypothetical protein [Bacteroidales bacterium]